MNHQGFTQMKLGREPKRASLPGPALYAYGPAVEGHQPFHDAKAEARTLVRSRIRSIHLRKWVKKSGLFIFGNAVAGIRNLEADTNRAVTLFLLQTGVERDPPLCRELNGVSKEIHQDLAQALRIPANPLGDRIVDRRTQLQTFRLGPHRYHFHRTTDAVAKIKGFCREFETVCVDL